MNETILPELGLEYKLDEIHNEENKSGRFFKPSDSSERRCCFLTS